MGKKIRVGRKNKGEERKELKRLSKSRGKGKVRLVR